MSTQAYKLLPWMEVLRPHEDIVEGRLEMSTYAADLGAVDRDDPHAPRVYRDAREFFRTTFPTRNLTALLVDVLSVLAGGDGDRVLQLRTPFGGGKTHALVALYHLMRSRPAVDAEPFASLPDPGTGRVAVLSGLDLDPHSPREVDGLRIRTLWGELAYRLAGREGYERVREQDEAGAAPGGNVLRPLLAGEPTLVLLDEVLVYVQRAGGAQGDDPRRRQAMSFLQGLSEVVRGLPNAAMVFSLQASAHEAAGEEALLTELMHLMTRVDAKREPVSDDEVMRVVQRRLFPEFGSEERHLEVAREVAREYALGQRRLREAFAETEADRRGAGVEAERFEQRAIESYPFHPALLDLMYHRWGSLASYQRTRGALQFLATVVAALWHGARSPQPLIGPGDVPFEDERVRGAFFSQVGERERYAAVLGADVTGVGARVAEVDRRLAADSPAYEQLRVATRCATAIMLYSFGGRDGEARGVFESELVQALVSPSLDRNVVAACLHDMRDELLYLHYTARRYRFEPKPNINLLLAEEMKKFDPVGDVLERVKGELAGQLREATDSAELWPPDSSAITDAARFRVVYLGPEWAELDEPAVQDAVGKLVEERGSGRRRYPNAVVFAVPGRAALDRARQNARLLLAVESLRDRIKTNRVVVESEQVDELDARKKSAAAQLGGAVESLYERVLVPVADREGSAAFKLEVVDLRAQLAAGRDLHTRILDALRALVFDTLRPARLVALIKLGPEMPFVAAPDLVEWFFSYFDFPKLVDEDALRSAIGEGTAGLLGYLSGASTNGGGLTDARPERVRFGAPTPLEEIDLGEGCFVLDPALARELRGEQPPDGEVVAPEDGREAAGDDRSQDRPEDGDRSSDWTVYRLRADLDAAQLFRILPGLQNLADRAQRFRAQLSVEAASGPDGWDRGWLRNAVDEHVEEAGLEPGSVE